MLYLLIQTAMGSGANLTTTSSQDAQSEKPSRLVDFARLLFHPASDFGTKSLINNRMVRKGIKNGASGVGFKGWG